MDQDKLRETIDSFVEGDYVYLCEERLSGNKHTFLQYASHDESYSEIRTQSKRHGPIHRSFWLSQPPMIMGCTTPVPIPNTGPKIEIAAESVQFLTNDMREAASYLKAHGEEEYARYVENMMNRD